MTAAIKAISGLILDRNSQRNWPLFRRSLDNRLTTVFGPVEQGLNRALQQRQEAVSKGETLRTINSQKISNYDFYLT